MSNANKPAYPQSHPNYDHSPGLTKRELIAAMCLQGLLANSEIVTAVLGDTTKDPEVKQKVFAARSVEFADALIEELQKEKK